MHKYSRDKTGFFTPDGKKHFCNLPMGIKNAAPFFCAMMLELKKIWSYEFFRTKEGLKFIKQVQEWYRLLAPSANQEVDVVAEILRKREKPDSLIIIDDLLMFAKSVLMLLAYFVAVLRVFVRHRVSIKLWKTRFLPSRAEFVGLDLLPSGNAPASSS